MSSKWARSFQETYAARMGSVGWDIWDLLDAAKAEGISAERDAIAAWLNESWVHREYTDSRALATAIQSGAHLKEPAGSSK